MRTVHVQAQVRWPCLLSSHSSPDERWPPGQSWANRISCPGRQAVSQVSSLCLWLGTWDLIKEAAMGQPSAWRNPGGEGSREKEEAEMENGDRKSSGQCASGDNACPRFREASQNAFRFGWVWHGFCYFQPKEPRLRISHLAPSVAPPPAILRFPHCPPATLASLYL